MSSETGYLGAVLQQAKVRPDAVAFELAGQERSTLLTYGALIDRVQQLGDALRRAGFGDGQRVALCMENRPAWAVAYLAVWYAGGVTVPLDTALDESALANLLDHAGAVVCITSTGLRTKLHAACRTMEAPPLLMLSDPLAEEGELEPVWPHPAGWDGEPMMQSAAEGGSSEPRLPEASFDAFVAENGSGDMVWAPARVDDETLGSIMYTSGTTGDPKGVMIRRVAVLENLRSGVARVHFAPTDRILGILPLFHVLPLITNCLGPLFVGARVVFLSELTAEAIMAAFRRHEITVFVCVPAFFYRFHDRLNATIQQAAPFRRRVAGFLIGMSRFARLRFGWNLGARLLRKAHRPFGDHMRLFITGGAKMNAQVYNDFLDWGFTLAQGYGLTEATAILTASPIKELRGDTVGRAIEGVELRIHEPDAEGIGEVWARSPSLMVGYYRNPEATAEALENGWLRTGDLGRLLPNNHLQITGRAKDVIVLSSGKNIYPDELEGYYGQSELVDELCIVGIPDDEGRGERLHAVVVPDLAAARRRGYVNVREMIKWDLEGMGMKMPGPKRLTSLEIRNEPLPRTPSRKIKRFVLEREIAERAEAAPGAVGGGEEWDAGESDAAPAGGDPETALAAEICAAVARYAKTERVGRRAHLDLDLGLESLDRIELLTELQQRLGVRLGEEVAGEVHTVGELIEAFEGAAADGATAPSGARSPDDAEGAGWETLLAETPEGVDKFLRRRPFTESFMWVVLRIVRMFWRLVAGYRITGIENIPDGYPFLICANHTSYVDPFFLCMGLPRRVLGRVFFVGYSEYFEGIVGSRLGRMMRNVPIDTNRNLGRAMQVAAEGLRRDMVLVIFPEGARSVDGRAKVFRKGSAVLARHLGAPIVPVGISGAFEVWPREGPIRRHPVSLAVGPPLAPDAATTDEELTSVLRDVVIGLTDEAERSSR